MTSNEFWAQTDIGDFRTVVWQGIGWSDDGAPISKTHTQSGVIGKLGIASRGFVLHMDDGDSRPISYDSVKKVV